MNGQAQPTRAGRILAQRIGATVQPPNIQRARIGTAAIHMTDALDQLRAAFITEADDEGQWTQAILDVQNLVHDALAGCQSMLLGMGEAQK